jgi:hypothetical protein
MEESIQFLMNENNKSFYPSNMFEFIHHLEYGCRDLKELKRILDLHSALNVYIKFSSFFFFKKNSNRVKFTKMFL